MRKFPEWTSGTARDENKLMAAIPGLLLKAGAEGVDAFALPDGTAAALKIDDGSARARTPVTVAILNRQGNGEMLAADPGLFPLRIEQATEAAGPDLPQAHAKQRQHRVARALHDGRVEGTGPLQILGLVLAGEAGLVGQRHQLLQFLRARVRGRLPGEERLEPEPGVGDHAERDAVDLQVHGRGSAETSRAAADHNRPAAGARLDRDQSLHFQHPQRFPQRAPADPVPRGHLGLARQLEPGYPIHA